MREREAERAREEAAEARRDVREWEQQERRVMRAEREVSAKYIVVQNGTSACYELNQSTNFRSKVLKVTN